MQPVPLYLEPASIGVRAGIQRPVIAEMGVGGKEQS